MSKTSVALKDLHIGDIIYTNVTINVADQADPNSKSTTAKKIQQGTPIQRLCIVLVPGTQSVQVTYLATLGSSTSLPATLDRTMWYPFEPATKEGSYTPLPPLSSAKAQWACLRIKQKITANPIDRVDDMQISADSAHEVLAAMKA